MVHKNGANFFMQIGDAGINAKSNPEIIYSPSSVSLPNKNKKT